MTGFDVWRIATGLELAPEQFLVAFITRPDDPDGFRLDQGETRCNLALDKIPGETQHLACIFWMELPGGAGRCGIYPHRPQVCETYPAYLDDRDVSLRGDVLCPPGAWKLGWMELGGWRERLSRFNVERDLYQSLLRRWNLRVEQAAPGTGFAVQELFDFLLNAYPLLAPIMAPVRAPGPLLDHWTRVHEKTGNPLDPPSGAADEDGPLGWAELIGEVRRVLADLFPGEAPFGESLPEEDRATGA